MKNKNDNSFPIGSIILFISFICLLFIQQRNISGRDFADSFRYIFQFDSPIFLVLGLSLVISYITSYKETIIPFAIIAILLSLSLQATYWFGTSYFFENIITSLKAGYNGYWHSRHIVAIALICSILGFILLVILCFINERQYLFLYILLAGLLSCGPVRQIVLCYELYNLLSNKRFNPFFFSDALPDILLIIGIIVSSAWLYQFKSYSSKKHIAKANTSSAESIDELLKYKKLLDDGVITEAEFSAKKQQLFH